VDAHLHDHDVLRSDVRFVEGHRGGGPEAEENDRFVDTAAAAVAERTNLG
jgi:hypothetical protein